MLVSGVRGSVVEVAICTRHRRHRDATRIRLDEARPVVYAALFDDDSSRQAAAAASTGSSWSRTCSPLVVRTQPGQRIVVTLRRSASVCSLNLNNH